MTKMWIPCPIRRLLQTSLIIENGSFWETDFIKLIYCIFRTKNAYNNFLWNTCTYHFFLFLRIHMKTESILHASSVWSRDGQERAITLWPFKGQWFNNTHNSVRVSKDLIFKKNLLAVCSPGKHCLQFHCDNFTKMSTWGHCHTDRWSYWSLVRFDESIHCK